MISMPPQPLDSNLSGGHILDGYDESLTPEQNKFAKKAVIEASEGVENYLTLHRARLLVKPHSIDLWIGRIEEALFMDEYGGLDNDPFEISYRGLNYFHNNPDHTKVLMCIVYLAFKYPSEFDINFGNFLIRLNGFLESVLVADDELEKNEIDKEINDTLSDIDAYVTELINRDILGN